MNFKMKLPKSFRPDKKLDKKIEALLEGNITKPDKAVFEKYGYIYDEISNQLNILVRSRKELFLFDMMLAISDSSKNSRYKEIAKMVGDIMEPHTMKWKIYNNFNTMENYHINKILDSWTEKTKSRLHIVYLSENILDRLKNYRAYVPFIDRCRITTID